MTVTVFLETKLQKLFHQLWLQITRNDTHIASSWHTGNLNRVAHGIVQFIWYGYLTLRSLLADTIMRFATLSLLRWLSFEAEASVHADC